MILGRLLRKISLSSWARVSLLAMNTHHMNSEGIACRVHPKLFVRSGKPKEFKRVEVGLAK